LLSISTCIHGMRVDFLYIMKTTRSGGTATTQLRMCQKVLGITVKTINETITLTCDKNGNLS